MDGREMSPDSSTLISEKSRKSKKRKHKHKSKTSHKKHKSSLVEGTHHRKSKKHKKKADRTPSQSEESEEEIIDIKPLSGYVDDKKQLYKEIFTLVTKKEVKNMLPDTLKKMKFKELKNLCLEQLEIMSQKRLRHIIAGQEMVSSSSDESAAETQETQQENKETDPNIEQSISDVTAKSIPPKETKATIPLQHTEQTPQPTKISILEEMSVSPNQDEIDELIEGETNVSQNPLEDTETETTQVTTDKNGTNLMLPEAELKELEFRARALKSLVMARERQQLEAKNHKELSEMS